MRTTAKACATGFLTALIAWVLSGCGKMPSAAEYMEQARAFHAKRDHKAAIILLKNVLSTAPDDSNAHLLLGTLYNETGEYVFAEMELRRAQLQMPIPLPSQQDLRTHCWAGASTRSCWTSLNFSKKSTLSSHRNF